MTMRPLHAVALGLLLGMSACSMPNTEQADERIRFFHSAFNDGRFGAMTAMTTPAFRVASMPRGFEPFIGKVRDKLGRVVHSTRTNWRVNYGTGGETTVIQQVTDFEHGKGQETFVFVEQSGKPQLNSYNINSPDLL